MRRTWRDVVISSAQSAYYAVVESLMLRIARCIYEKEYRQKDGPLISVYCPTYNRGQILMERAVRSVLAQTYKNFEFIIVGDCCTDNTAKLVADIKDKRVKFYNLPQKSRGYPEDAEGRWLAGPVGAANTALELVRGKWIARIDDDDTWAENHLEELLKFAQEGQYEFVSALHEEERRGKRRVVNGESADGPYYNGQNKLLETFGPKIGCTQTWLYRSYLRFMRYNIDCWRKSWNRVNDADLSIRIFKAGVRMGFLEKVLAFVYPRPGENTIGLEAYKEAETLDREVHN